MQLLTGREAWEGCSNPVQIIFAVGVERRRLPIPAACPPPLAHLLKECWRHNAPLRPSFSEVVQRLRALRSLEHQRQQQHSAKSSSLLAYPADSNGRVPLPGGAAAAGKAQWNISSSSSGGTAGREARHRGGGSKPTALFTPAAATQQQRLRATT